jgi:hypothetical protein
MITLLVNPNNSQTERVIGDAQEAAPTKWVHPQILKASTASEIDAAFGTLDQLQARALLLVPDAFFSSRQEQLLLAARQAIPAIYRSREWTERKMTQAAQEQNAEQSVSLTALFTAFLFVSLSGVGAPHR